MKRISWGVAVLFAVLAFYSWLGAMGQKPGDPTVDPKTGMDEDGHVHISTPVTSPDARPEVRENMGISGHTSGTAAGSVNSSGTGQGSGVGSNVGTSNSNRAE